VRSVASDVHGAGRLWMIEEGKRTERERAGVVVVVVRRKLSSHDSPVREAEPQGLDRKR